MLETEEQILSKQPYVPIIPLLPADLESHINKFKDGSSFRYSYNSTSLTSTKSFKKTSGNLSTRCELCLKNISVYVQCQGYCGLKFCSACCGIKHIKRMSRVHRELWRCKRCRRDSYCQRSKIASNGVSEDSSEDHLTSQANVNNVKWSSSANTWCEICLKTVSIHLQCHGYCNLKFCSACCGVSEIKRMSKSSRETWKCKYCRINRKPSIRTFNHLPQQNLNGENSFLSDQAASSGASDDSSEVSSDSECSQSNSKAQWVNGMVNGRWRKKQKLDKPRDYKLNSIQCDVSNRRTTIQRSSRFYANCKNTETVKNSLSRQLRSSSRKVRKSYTSAYDSGSNAPSSSSSSSLSLSSSSSSSSSEEDDDKTQEQRTEINKIKTCQKDLRSQPLTRDASGSGKFLRPKPTPTLRYKMDWVSDLICGACSNTDYSGGLIDCTGPCCSSYHYYCMGISKESFKKYSKLVQSSWKCKYCKDSMNKTVTLDPCEARNSYTSTDSKVGISKLVSDVICGKCFAVGGHNSELITCIGPCSSTFHYYCIGMSKENFRKLSRAYKSSWMCKKCRDSKKTTSFHHGAIADNIISSSLQIHVPEFASEVICEVCSSTVVCSSEIISCVGPCCSKYHYYCIGMSKENFQKLSRARKSTWKCSRCRNSKKTVSTSELCGMIANSNLSKSLQATVVLERLQIKSQFKNKDSEKTNSCKPSKPQKKYKFIATPQRKRNHVKDSEESDSDFYYSSDRAALHVTVGDFVWAKLGSQRWWPAIIIWGADCGQPAAKHNQTWVLWCGEHKISEVPKNKLLNFVTHFNRKFNGFAGYKFEKGIIVVLTELAVRAKVQGISKEPKSLITWAKNGFPSTQKKSNPFAPDPECPIPDSIRKRLNRIKAQYLKTMWSEQGVSLIPRFVRSEQLQDEESALKKVRQGILKIQEVCIACDASNVDIVAQHPLIEGGLCSYCKEEITETMFAYGDDGTNAYCVICGQAGELLICDNHDCNRCYCTGCIDVLVSPGAHIKVRNSSPWLCYLCRPYDAELNGLIQRKEDWQQSVMLFFKSNDNIQFPPNMEDYKEKKPVRVLSLFDGIGTGRLVLEQLGIDVDIYYASEIDKDAINIALVQHRGNIVHLGDIEDITDVEVAKLCPIDLVIGGSPCNDLALVNPRRKGLYDPTGTGKLFFDFFRVLRAVQMANKGRHVFWLYENVAGMPSQYKSTITRFLQCEPTLVDAKYFSAQRRARFFWGNIPGMYTVQEYWSAEEMPNPLQNEELYQTVTLNSVLTPYLNRKASLEKIGSLTTQTNSLRQGKVGMYPVTMNGEEDTLWITELEEVFGFPRHYTDVGNVQLKRRQELLGKAWSVPVIRHLFTSLRNFFKTLPSSFLQKTGNKES